MYDDFMVYFSFIIIFAAAMLHGCIGFGFGMAAIPLLSLFIPPKDAIVICILIGTILNGYLAVTHWKIIHFKRILPMFLSSLVGLPLGTTFLVYANSTQLKIVVGIVIIVFCGAFLRGITVQIKNEKKAFIVTGLLSGLLAGAIGMGGYPIVLFFSNQSEAKDTFKANLVAFFFGIGIIILVMQYFYGLITPDIVKSGLTFLPFMIGGMLLGHAIYKRLHQAHFEQIVFGVLIVSGITLIMSSIF